MTPAGIRLVRRTHLDLVRYVGCLCCAPSSCWRRPASAAPRHRAS